MARTGTGLWLIGGVALVGLTAFFVAERGRRALHGELATLQSAHRTQGADLAAMAQARQSLADALQAAEASRAEIDVRRSAAEARLNHLTQRAAELELGLATAKQETERMTAEVSQLRESLALATLQVAQAGADEVARYQATIAELESRLAEATAEPAPSVPTLPGESRAPAQPLAVVGVGPADAFVVLALPADHRASSGQRWLISRGTDSLAQVLIGEVQTRHAIAHVVPGSLRGGLHPGDLATITASP